ncbi:hypothetical protein GF318_05350 [Candidatus Micrarchaeota archaeon]|nr:hypothetical protein [Candidatus Micrarchaeota archaeon]
MQRIDVFDIIRSLFFGPEKVVFSRFMDPLGNFEIFYPKKWKFDRDIAVVEGKYTVQFESKKSTFTISVDASLPLDFDFRKYAKKELESPTAGILATARKTTFRGMPAFKREYSYYSEGREYFGGGVMFYNGDIVVSLSWSAPEKDREKQEAIFSHMIDRLVVYKGFNIRKG